MISIFWWRGNQSMVAWWQPRPGGVPISCHRHAPGCAARTATPCGTCIQISRCYSIGSAGAMRPALATSSNERREPSSSHVGTLVDRWRGRDEHPQCGKVALHGVTPIAPRRGFLPPFVAPPPNPVLRQPDQPVPGGGCSRAWASRFFWRLAASQVRSSSLM
jgi:hypothetical protein